MIKSLAYPNMFMNKSHTIVSEDEEAIRNNLYLAIGATKLSMLGDPYFGSQLETYLFYTDSQILYDLIIEDLLSTIHLFVPEIQVTREDITLVPSDTTLSAQVRYLIKGTNVSNMYEIKLLEAGEDK